MTRAAWWLIAAGACRESVERLGWFTIEAAREAATAADLVWARGGGGYGYGDGGGDGGGGGFSGDWYTDDDGAGAGYGNDDGAGEGSGWGGPHGWGLGSGGGRVNGSGHSPDDGEDDGLGAGSADIVSITIDGEVLTPAECRERVRRWAM